MDSSDGKDIKTLLLVGRSGNGKTSIGNAILGPGFFSTEQKGEKKEATEIYVNKEFKVIDCSGIGDTGEDMAGSLSDVFNAANAAVVEGEKYGGIQAVVFVLKYGVRYTKQEKDAVQRVKEIFGDDVFKNWGVLAFSYGDNFENDTKISFNDWCRWQEGDIKNVFQEVNYRCVLFNKKAESSHEKSRMLLKKCIKEIQSTSKQKLQVGYAVNKKLHSNSKVNDTDSCRPKCCFIKMTGIKNSFNSCWSRIKCILCCKKQFNSSSCCKSKQVHPTSY